MSRYGEGALPRRLYSAEVRKINQSAYHHGNLRSAIVAAALQAIGESGPAGWSLRELARRAGVSCRARSPLR